MEKIRSLFRIGLLSFLMGCCTSGGVSVAIDSPKVDQRGEVDVEHLRNVTVALVENIGIVKFPLCSGIWISKDKILTAYHCVDNDEKSAYQYSTFDEFENDEIRTAVVLTKNKQHDLAILLADPAGLIDHPVAVVSEKDASTGDEIHIMGHPVGYAWTYSHGYISSVRGDMLGPSGLIEKVFQISAPVWMGNSGGGAFDSNGNLVGICSWVSKSGPQLTFFIHKDLIKQFIKNSE